MLFDSAGRLFSATGPTNPWKAGKTGRNGEDPSSRRGKNKAVRNIVLVNPMILTSSANFVPMSSPDSARWQQAMKGAVRDPAELCRLLGLPDEVARQATEAAGGFPLFAPRGYIARMRPGDLDDPLLRQVLPLPHETADEAGFSRDPVGDGDAQRRPGLLQKYQGRALLITTGACAVHCRYCFRRHFPYGDTPHSLPGWQAALADLRADTSISEIILSGGDPLVLVDSWLAELSTRLAAIGHLRRIRLHTRLPIMIPERVDDRLLAWLTGTRLVPVVVIHANHAQELDAPVAESLLRLTRAGVTLLNQTVLLRGINDRVETLAELSERLAELRVVPYYLHQLDRVAGAAHFEVPEAEGRRLVAALRARLPGYLVPRYVREVAGEPSKVPLL